MSPTTTAWHPAYILAMKTVSKTLASFEAAKRVLTSFSSFSVSFSLGSTFSFSVWLPSPLTARSSSPPASRPTTTMPSLSCLTSSRSCAFKPSSFSLFSSALSSLASASVSRAKMDSKMDSCPCSCRAPTELVLATFADMTVNLTTRSLFFESRKHSFAGAGDGRLPMQVACPFSTT